MKTYSIRPLEWKRSYQQNKQEWTTENDIIAASVWRDRCILTNKWESWKYILFAPGQKPQECSTNIEGRDIIEKGWHEFLAQFLTRRK